MTHRYADAALAEFIAAGRYYNGQVPGLGDEFVDEIETAVQAVVSAPQTWRVIEEGVRRYFVRRFPYGIYYTIENEVVVSRRASAALAAATMVKP